MGGKHKQSQRTKNNVRPSSSGRSAELLGSNVSSFVGFSTMKETGYVPALPSFTEDFDSNINPNFHLVLKKMNKKDAVTKLKALCEFGSLCRESEAEAVKAILPFWPRLYCVLATDTEHRVREAAHNAHKAVVTSVGRSIAPYLKQIAGAWFTSQYDTYPPAASAASLSFQEAFPPNKLIEAIIFCQEEILNYIYDNLINQTPQMLSNPKITSPEEMEAKYQRVIISSLHGYGLYLSKLPEEQIVKAEELNRKLISNSKFWKFAKHSTNNVRVAWFSAIISLFHKAPFLLSNEKKHVCTAVFSTLDDSDSVVLSVVWEAALQTVVSVENWWELVSAEKLVFPKLWRVLKDGGLGSAAAIFPNILPLLSKIPESLIHEKYVFYSKFFSSLQEGMKQRNVQISASESDAVAECYIECFCYIIMLNIDDEEICAKLVKEQLIPAIEKTLTDANIQLLRRSFCHKLVSMLIQWSRHKLKDSYSPLLNMVLEEIIPVCYKLIDESALDKKQMKLILDTQFDLVSSFKYQQANKLKKRMKVTFSEERSPEVESTPKPVLENIFKETSVEFQSKVNNLVQKLVHKYFESVTAIETCKNLFVAQLAKLITVFDSKDIFDYLISISIETKSWNEFYTKYISVWLKDKEILTEDVSHLIFAVMKHNENEDEKELILHSLSEDETKKILYWCLKNEYSSFTSFKQWLSSDKMDSVILSIIEEALRASDSNKGRDAENIIKACLKQGGDGDILIKYETLIFIINYLKKTLVDYKDRKKDIGVEVCGKLITICLNSLIENMKDKDKESVLGVILECFKFCLIDIVSTEVDKTWSEAVTSIALLNESSYETIKTLTKLCSDAVNDVILSRTTMVISDLRHIVQQCIKYIASVEKSSQNLVVDEFIEIFMDRILLCNNEYCDSLFVLCYCCEVIDNRLSLPFVQKELSKDLALNNLKNIFIDNKINKFFNTSLFHILLLLNLFGIDEYNGDIDDRSISDDYDDVIGKNIGDNCEIKNITLNYYTVHLADCILKVAAARIFKNNFLQTKQYLETSNVIDMLEQYTKELVQRLDSEGSKSIERELINRGHSIQGSICAEAMHILHAEFLEMENSDSVLQSITEDNKLACSTTDMLSVWLPQVFACGDIAECSLTNIDHLHELILLTCHLQKQKYFAEDSTLRKLLNSWKDKVFEFKKLPTFEVDLSTCSESDISFAAYIAKLLSLMIENHASLINDTFDWDFTMIAVASWISSIKKTYVQPINMNNLVILHLSCSTVDLYRSVSNYFNLPELDGSQVKTEWFDVFLSDVNNSLIDIWINISDLYQDKEINHPLVLVVLNKLSEVINKSVDISTTIEHSKSSVPQLLETYCQYLQSSAADIQFTAYNFLLKMASKIASDTEGNEGSNVDLSLKHIEDVLKMTQTIVDTMLSDFKLGDTCIVEPFTDAYVYTRSYLLLWLVLLEICDKADSQLRVIYTTWIKENHFLGYLMKSLFCLMPEKAVHGHEANIKHMQELFSNPPEITSGLWYSKKLAHLSCWTYYKLLGRLPAEVRQWWSEIDHKVATIIERLTTTYVSPLLCSNELKAVRREGSKSQNMKVRVHTAAREVFAEYVVEESSMELVIQLSINHPLGPTKVESGKCMVSTNQTRQWVMQLTLFLTHQNGSIWDALTLWKTFIDKKFEGVEECYICYAILHSVTQQLPKFTCHTCKKKFHNNCLYRWFTTSNKSTCPICRNQFWFSGNTSSTA